jgi:TolB-like protein/class 3 adenylate cyclase/Tfp pilus assembly protein PilF
MNTIQKDIRQLAAIIFTDMVGYTAMMQQDEQKAKKNRDRHRKVLEKSTEDHHGLILQYYGDGTLSVFGSAIDAVECAVEIQQNLQKEPKVPLRIGIHIGDVVYADDGIYGDAVNIASRIENLSAPGGILISGKVYDEIKNHPELPAKSLGEFELKNVKRPVHVFAIAKEGLLIPTSAELKGKVTTSIKSIAVLPFVNMSTDPENEYFSDGITEELLNALTKVDGLQVTSRTSSFAFKGKNEDIRQIGTQLNVTSVLEGSVRKAGNKVRITAQLINTADGYHVWSDVYDRNLDDIFEVQDEISRKITHTLREKLTRSEAKEKIVKSPTKNLDAYNLYLKGRFYYNKWSPPEAKKAIKLFEEAISIEQAFALPYSGLSECYCLLGSMGQLPSDIAFPKAKEMAIKALELDNNLADSHAVLAWIMFFYELDWKSTEESYKTAILLNPDSAVSHQGYAVYLLVKEKYEDALKEIELAMKLDPLSLSINFSFSYILYCSGRIKDSLNQYDKTLEIDPTFRSAIESKGYVYAKLGEYDKSLEIFKQVYEQLDDPLKGVTGLGYAYAKAGNIQEAEKYLDKLKKREQKEKDINLLVDYAIIYSALRDYDKVFYYLEKAIEARVGILNIFADPGWKELRSDPRYEKLKNKIRL